MTLARTVQEARDSAFEYNAANLQYMMLKKTDN